MPAKKAQKKKVTITEFQKWIEGIVEFQPEDWRPSDEQWATILEKINNLTNEKDNESEKKQVTIDSLKEQVDNLKEVIESISRASSSRHTRDYGEPLPENRPEMYQPYNVGEDEMPVSGDDFGGIRKSPETLAAEKAVAEKANRLMREQRERNSTGAGIVKDAEKAGKEYI